VEHDGILYRNTIHSSESKGQSGQSKHFNTTASNPCSSAIVHLWSWSRRNIYLGFSLRHKTSSTSNFIPYLMLQNPLHNSIRSSIGVAEPMIRSQSSVATTSVTGPEMMENSITDLNAENSSENIGSFSCPDPQKSRVLAN
jgi:hypothetical protein